MIQTGRGQHVAATVWVVAIALAAMLMAALATSGCSAKTPLAKARVGVVSVTGLVKAVDDIEEQAYAEKLFSADVHKRNAGIVIRVVDGALAYEAAVREWSKTPEAPEPSAVSTARRVVLAGVDELLGSYKNDQLLAVVASLRLALGVAEVVR